MKSFKIDKRTLAYDLACTFLSRREVDVLHLRNSGKTYRYIGSLVYNEITGIRGISISRVQQIRASAIRKIRKYHRERRKNDSNNDNSYI